MIVRVRTMFVAVPLAAALTAAATTVIFETPWNALPGIFGGMAAAGTGPLVALGRVAPEPDTVMVTVADTPAEVLDTVTVIELPDPAADSVAGGVAAAALPAREPNEPIDYMRLNADVHVVTDTLERFNQKLLRMIAQAKAGQRVDPSAVDADATVALDAPVTPVGPETELKQ